MAFSGLSYSLFLWIFFIHLIGVVPSRTNSWWGVEGCSRLKRMEERGSRDKHLLCAGLHSVCLCASCWH